MADDLLSQLKAVDPAILTEVVRKDLYTPDLSILDWTVEPISFEKFADNTGGLFRFAGHALSVQGIEPWTVAVKRIQKTVGWEQRDDWYNGRREILAFQSGLLENLPPGIRAPRCYEIVENEVGAWIWIEFIRETTSKQWTPDHFHRAARQLGRFQSAYLCGTDLPAQPWVCQPFYGKLWEDDGWWAGFLNPTSEEYAWKSPVVQGRFDDRQKRRVLQLLEEKLHFFDANERLPQVLCHNDTGRRNFMWTFAQQGHHGQSGQEELIAVDWALTSIGALGNDLGAMLGDSLYFFDYDPYDAQTLEAIVMEGYLAGIADMGVEIDARLVRLGYLMSLSFWWAPNLPIWAVLFLTPEAGIDVQAAYGHSAEEVLAGWVHLEDIFLERADEARSLIKELGL